MFQIKRLVDRWTEIAVQVFNRHKPEDGSDHPDREKLIEMNKVGTRNKIHVFMGWGVQVNALN